jgi:hypothetical protein
MATQIAATIYAQLTQQVTATFTPSPTLPPTATPKPTETAQPTPTAGTPEPSATVQVQGDAAKFVGTAPRNYAEIMPNQFYNLEFDFLNVGTTTWGPGYHLFWMNGEQFTSVTQIALDREVPPGKKGVFILGTFGSEEWRPHTTCWQLFAPNGVPVPGGKGCFTYKPV